MKLTEHQIETLVKMARGEKQLATQYRKFASHNCDCISELLKIREFNGIIDENIDTQLYEFLND